MQKTLFSEMDLSAEVQKAIVDMGFEEATPIQSQAIPQIIAGGDLIGQSQTGTGKTVAFSVPIVEKVNAQSHKIQALVLCPTRELCMQVAEQVTKLSKHKKGIFVLPIFGGQSYEHQLHGLRKGVQIVIGTPGRMIDHMKKGYLKLDALQMVVLDEADEMLDMGFQEDIEFILAGTPKNRQSVLFSATMPSGLKNIIRKYLTDPQTIQVTHEELTVPNTEQLYVELKNNMKSEALCRFIDMYHVKLGIVFCNTKIGVDELVSSLQSRGYFADGLHGDMKQMMRDRVMTKFRTGKTEILVATDVAARGIDVNNIEMVFNFDLPKDEEDYVHRIGRTGRAGREGRAISFATVKEANKLRQIQKYAKVKIKRISVPTLDDVEEVKYEAMLTKIKGVIAAGSLGKYLKYVEKLTEDDATAAEVAAALLKMTLPETIAPSGKTSDGRMDFGMMDGKGDHSIGGDVPAKLFLNVGKMQNVRPKDIVGAIAGETGIKGSQIGNILVSGTHTIAEVPADLMDMILEKMRNVRIKGVKITVKRAEF